MAKQTQDLVKLDSSTELATNSGVEIKGLEEVPTNIIPLPFYKVVQYSTTEATLANGKEAEPGTFYRNDVQSSMEELEFALVRAKRQVREFEDNPGESKRVVQIAILGMNLSNFQPFVLTVPVTSFSNFGRMMAKLKELKASAAWEYKITAKTEKTVNKKNQKYFIVNFEVGEKFDEDTIALLSDAYNEFAASLDREGDEAELSDSDRL